MKKNFTQLFVSTAILLITVTRLVTAAPVPVAADSQQFLPSVTNTDYQQVPNSTKADTQYSGEAADFTDKQLIFSNYPYALTSYLAHKHKLTSSNTEKQAAVDNRLALHGYKNITAEELPLSWQGKGNKVYQTKGDTHSIYNKGETNLYGRVFINDQSQKIIVAFAGTEFNALKYGWRVSSTLYTSFMASYASFFKGPEQIPMMQKAVKVTRDIAEKFPGYEVELSGSSLGGGIAQFVALETGYSARVFNSLALSDTIYSHFAETKPDHKPEDLITHVYLAGELLNDSYDPTSYLIQGHMPVAGHRIEVPSQVSAEIDSSVFTGWSRHWAGSVLKVMEYHLDPGHQLPTL